MYSNYWHNVKYGYEKAHFQEAVERDLQYVHISEYAGQLMKYLDYFPLEHVLVVKFESLVSNQLNSLNQCEKFLGVALTTQAKARQDNASKSYTMLGRRMLDNRILRHADRIVPNELGRFVKRWLTKDVPPLKQEERNRVMHYFSDDQASLDKHFGIAYRGYLEPEP